MQDESFPKIRKESAVALRCRSRWQTPYCKGFVHSHFSACSRNSWLMPKPTDLLDQGPGRVPDNKPNTKPATVSHWSERRPKWPHSNNVKQTRGFEDKPEGLPINLGFNSIPERLLGFGFVRYIIILYIYIHMHNFLKSQGFCHFPDPRHLFSRISGPLQRKDGSQRA